MTRSVWLACLGLSLLLAAGCPAGEDDDETLWAPLAELFAALLAPGMTPPDR